MKKRYILFAWIALEILTLPVAALGVKSIDFNLDRLKVTTAIPILQKPGLTSFIVMSQGPFAITAKGEPSNFGIILNRQGYVNGNRYGENAHLPGAMFKCSNTQDSDTRTLYMSDSYTSSTKAPILSRSIRVDVYYDPTTTPEIDIMAHWKAEATALAKPCKIMVPDSSQNNASNQKSIGEDNLL